MEIKGHWIESIYEAFVRLGGGPCSLKEIEKEVEKIRLNEGLTWKSLKSPQSPIRREIQERCFEMKNYKGKENYFKHHSKGIYSLVNDIKNQEKEKRLKIWKSIKKDHSINEVPINQIREKYVIYSGQAGIYKKGSDITYTVNHNGSTYADDLSLNGLLYHYPKTKRKGKDKAEINATKKCMNMNIPIFILLPLNSDKRTRPVRLGYVRNYDDKNMTFQIDFSIDSEEIINDNKEFNSEFNLKTDRAMVKRESYSMQRDQHKFKFELVKRYGYKCGFCDIKDRELLQACHIVPVSKKGSDSSGNGLMLCANCHILFDKLKVKIHPKTLEIKSQSKTISNKKLLTLTGELPEYDALNWHFKQKA